MQHHPLISLGSYQSRFYDPAIHGVRDEPVDLTLTVPDLMAHLHVAGKTGAGKTSFFKNFIAQLIEHGYGVSFIDLHGDAALEMLDVIPSHRINDVIYFDPLDNERPIGINPLGSVPEGNRYLVVQEFVGICHAIWADSWGVRLQRILTQTVAALIEHPTGTILGINRMLTNWQYRNSVLEYVTDQLVLDYWRYEFPIYAKSNHGDAVTPVLNKIGDFIASPSVRNIIGQTKSTINFRTIMDEGQIFIGNLSEGRLGEQQAKLLGSFITSGFANAAYSRIDIKEQQQRRPHILVLDEFQKITNHKLPKYLSEVRKFKLGFVVAHQYFDQLEDEVIAGIKGNVKQFITFQQGIEDAEKFTKIFARDMSEDEFINLFPNEAWAKIEFENEEGITRTKKFIATPQWFDIPSYGNTEKIIGRSKKKFGANGELIRQRVAKRLAPIM